MGGSKVCPRARHGRLVPTFQLNMTIMSRRLAPTAAMLLLLTLSARGQQLAIYVDDDATGANTGTSWSDAYTDRQMALDDPSFANPLDIWVAEGTYVPSVRTNANTPRSETFLLNENLGKIYGAFKPGDPTLAARSGSRSLTHLSGDLPGNPRGAFHVATLDGNGTAAGNEVRLNGFTITGGEATGAGTNQTFGGGILCCDSFLRLEECILNKNVAGDDGAGAFVRDSRLEVKQCTFDDNSVLDTGGGIAIYDTVHHALVWNCLFKNNRTTTTSGFGLGAGLFVAGPTADLVRVYNCVFHDNVADQGAGLHCFSGDIQVGNCTVAYNYGKVRGAGVFACSTTVLSNSIVFDNVLVGLGGAGGTPPTDARPGVDYFNGFPLPTVRFSDCQQDIVGGVFVDPVWTGSNGNITASPTYVSVVSRKLALTSTSAGVDVGDNASVFDDLMDLDKDTTTTGVPTPYHKEIGQPRQSSLIPGSVVDMGAYEFQW